MRDEADLVNRIFDFIKLGKTDKEIATEIKASLSRVYSIRVIVLEIFSAGRKRICVNCGEPKAITLFNTNPENQEHIGWCIICRRKIGLIPYFRKITERPAEDPPSLLTVRQRCLNCCNLFYTEIVEQTQYKTVVKNKLCEKCRCIEDQEDGETGSINDINWF
jgi:hypothetical protein